MIGTKRTRIRKVTKKPLGVLKRKLDCEFAQMIRDRDQGLLCISCRKNPSNQAGHFIRREILATRWHPKNANGQCAHCNCWLHGNLLEYADGMHKKYSILDVVLLRELARKSWKPTREALESLLAAAKLGHEAYQEIWDFYGSESK